MPKKQKEVWIEEQGSKYLIHTGQHDFPVTWSACLPVTQQELKQLKTLLNQLKFNK
jgi:hypothetical protein